MLPVFIAPTRTALTIKVKDGVETQVYSSIAVKLTIQMLPVFIAPTKTALTN